MELEEITGSFKFSSPSEMLKDRRRWKSSDGRPTSALHVASAASVAALRSAQKQKKKKKKQEQTGGDGRLVMAIGLVDDERQTEEETEGQRKKERKK